MKPIEIFFFAIGIVLILFGLAMTGGGIADIFDPERDQEYTVFFMLSVVFVMGILPTIGGGWLCHHMYKTMRNRKVEEAEREILCLAQEHQGRLTIADVTINTSLSSAEAKKALDLCNMNGLTDVEVTDSGAVVYRFYDIISDDERNESKGLE